MTKAPVAIIILDGLGWRNEVMGNAVAQANKPNFDHLLEIGRASCRERVF